MTRDREHELTEGPTEDEIVHWLMTEYRSKGGAGFQSEKAARRAARSYINTMKFVAREERAALGAKP